MFAAASRYLARRSELGASRRWAHSIKDQFEEYGKMVFTGKIAEDYLSKHGSSGELLSDPTWVNHSSDTVAEAVFDWYVSNDSDVWTRVDDRLTFGFASCEQGH